MALYYDLPVFNDTYRLTLKIFELTKNFSREYKFTLGQDMKRDCLMLVRSIYRANKNKQRETYLEQFLDEFEVLKLEIRLCKDLHLIRKSDLIPRIKSDGIINFLTNEPRRGSSL